MSSLILKRLSIPVGLSLITYASVKYTAEKERGLVYGHRDRSQVEPHISSDLKVLVLKSLPFRSISRLWGYVNNQYELPVFMREFIYSSWMKAFDGHPEEMERPYVEYRNLGEFFTRRLRPGCRPVHPQAELVSPADCKVLHYGPVEGQSLEQIKGVTFSMDAFLGVGSSLQSSQSANQIRSNTVDESRYHTLPFDSDNNRLYHVVLYLGPGDYHRFHSPAEWQVERLKHFGGRLFSVAPALIKMVRGLFVLNERVVMLGDWRYGFFAMAAVGATNVGSIELVFDKSLRTNKWIKGRFGSYEEKVFCGSTKNSDDDNAKEQEQGDVNTDHQSRSKIVKLHHEQEDEEESVADQMMDMIDPPEEDVELHVSDELDQSEDVQNSGVGGGGLQFRKGDEVGLFNLGSSIILVFEAPKDFRFCIKEGQKLNYGQIIGSCDSKLVPQEYPPSNHPPLHSQSEVDQYLKDRDASL
ncbi:hypothetical protein MP228_012448 [Amoeboaphelidium protococcarum]|nr:hypothetical protein MP228_012448 [Amoeboaphelidium protococcarum]